MRAIPCAFLASLVITAATVTAAASAPDLVQFAGAERVATGAERFAEILWPSGSDRTRWPSVAGELQLAFYRLPASTTPVEAWRDLERELGARGFRILGRCQERECRDDPRFVRHFDDVTRNRKVTALPGWPASPGELMFLSEPHGLIAERGTGPREFVLLRIGRARVDYAVREVRGLPMLGVVHLREAAPALGQVRVLEAGELGEALTRDGRVPVYGLTFDTDSAVLTPAAARQIERIARLLRQQPALALYVVGHTDGAGSLATNEELSRRRAESVVSALVAQGIAAARLTARGVGPYAPVASNSDERGRALNRRVELVVR